MKKKKTGYTPAKMVNWFQPAMLFQTLLKAVISSLFGNYADKREMEAALSTQTTEQLDELGPVYDKKELWIDFISDTGDGFDSTFSVARLAALPKLTVIVDDKPKDLPRGNILILGGDQIYPTPTADLYTQKFKIPFSSALPEKKNDDTNAPHMYAIPGNHDWYDGLGNFIKIFCQQRNIGAWKTQQQRSYFAIPLPYHYWIWATDIQLNADIDQPQLKYFIDVACKMKQDDKVILITAEPSWVYHELYADDKSYNRLQFFIENYITQDPYQRMGKTFKLKAVLTGDLHHYARYIQTRDCLGLSPHYICAGGGGAFLHLTHNLPGSLHLPAMNRNASGQTENTIYARLAAAYPSTPISRKLNTRNFMFAIINRYFCAMMGFIYVFIFWMLVSNKVAATSFIDLFVVPKANFMSITFHAMAMIPTLCILSALLIYGFYGFTDIRSGRRAANLIGLLHGLLQVFCIYLVIGGLTLEVMQHITGKSPMAHYIILLFCIFFGGWLFSGLLMGVYLYATNAFLNMHIDEASSSLACADYKNFLRLCLTEDGVMVYPVGIEKVNKSWEVKQGPDGPIFSGDPVSYHLIEPPYNIDKYINH